MTNNKGIMALGLFLALLSGISASANDGRTFHQVRPASEESGKQLTSKDVVYGRGLRPRRAHNPFAKQKEIVYPFSEVRGDALWAMLSAADSVLIAKGGDGIVYGQSVSRNEFGINGGIFEAPDRSKVAFYRKDESRVAQFPFLDITVDGGAYMPVRYPMNDSASERITLGVYDYTSGSTIYLDTDGDFEEDRYLTNITWSPDSRSIYIQVLSRSQQDMVLCSYDALSGKKTGTLLTEHSDTWVEPQYPLFWVNDRQCIYSTDNRDGWWNLYLLDTVSGKVERLCKHDAHMEYLANDGRNVYFTGPDFHPVNNHLWKVDLRTRKVTRLTKEDGWHSTVMSPDCKTFMDVWQKLDVAPRTTLVDTRTLKVLETLQESDDVASAWAFGEITMGTVTSANGEDLNYYRMVKPAGFNPNRKYPLILYVYGGPHAQLVTNTYLGGLRMWEMYAASKGFVVFVMDGRGTPRHRTAYEHSIYRQCGQNEMADQMQAIAMLRDIPWIDSDRIGVYGWSYGGFMSLSLSTNHNDVFKVAVAGGPVIDWKWYEVMYGERYMSRQSLNPEGFSKTSLLNKVQDVKARTLVIEGAVDATVVPLHALSFIQGCIDHNIPIEYFTYPKAEHNMRGSDRVHLVEKITDFFVENL